MTCGLNGSEVVVLCQSSIFPIHTSDIYQQTDTVESDATAESLF